MKYKQKQQCDTMSKLEIISANYIAFLKKKKYLILKFILSILDLICMNANKIIVYKDSIDIYNDKDTDTDGFNSNEISISKNIIDIYLNFDKIKRLKTLLNISDNKIDNEKITLLDNLGFVTQAFKYGFIYFIGKENFYKDINTIIKHDLSCINYNQYNLTPSAFSSKFKLKLAKIIKNMFLKTNFCNNIN